VDLALIGHYDQLLRDIELSMGRTATHHDANTLYLLRTVPGIGDILSLVLLYEIHDIQRFPRVQDFVSSCRLVTCAKESAGKRYGTAGTKIGNAYLTWAFSEAAGLFLRHTPRGSSISHAWRKNRGKARPGRYSPISSHGRSTLCSPAQGPVICHTFSRVSTERSGGARRRTGR